MHPILRKFVIPLVLIELLAFFFAWDVDLQARWFGALVGLAAGLILWLFRRPAWGFAFLAGYLSGTICDLLYLVVFGSACHCLLAALWGALAAVLVKSSWGKRFSRVHVFTALCVLIVTAYMTLPNLLLERRDLPEGIYVYANDVVYKWPVLNIVSSRLGVMVHTGICFVTRDPFSFNRQRREAGLPTLDFRPLVSGYWINDLNLDVQEQTYLANYASKTQLDNRPYDFDLEHMDHYLWGRSVNDRVKPSIRFVPLVTSKPREDWNRIVQFRDQINAQYPDGFIYSPIPYDGLFVRLYNCNTITVGIADEFLDRGEEAARLTNLPLNVGRQGVHDGRLLMRDYRTNDFQSRIDRERESWKSEPTKKRHWLHRILFHKAPEWMKG